MRKLAGIILTPIFYICFGVCLIIFHPIQWLSLNLGGYKSHKRSVDILNFFLTSCNYVLFNSVTFIANKNLPLKTPIVFVANHQSTFDIPAMIYFLRNFHAKFISKIELANAGLPSISYNLKHGGAANIDRKDSKQAIKEILNLANNMKERRWSAVIFPEGTRTKTGKMRKFAVGGIATLLKKNPDALIVPIAIKGSYDMVSYGMFPLRPFTKLSWEMLEPIAQDGRPVEDLVEQAEIAIRNKVEG